MANSTESFSGMREDLTMVVAHAATRDGHLGLTIQTPVQIGCR
jgi:hypothetical protein